MQTPLFPVLLILLAGMSPTLLSAQATFTVTNKQSDNFTNIAWDLNDYNSLPDGCQITSLRFSNNCDAEIILYDQNIAEGYLESNEDIPFGPNRSFRLDVRIGYSCSVSGPSSLCFYSDQQVTTQPIFPPKNVRASEGYGPGAIEITWSKGTDLDESDVNYYIYRDGVHIATTSGSTYRLVDLGYGNGSLIYYPDYDFNPNTTRPSNFWASPLVYLAAGVAYNYEVSTVYLEDLDQESAKIADSGRTIFFTASDGAHAGRTDLTFNNSSRFADHVRVFRGNTEIALLDPSATSYSDYNGVPGEITSYTIQFIKDDGTVVAALGDPGYSRPNGVIRGTVKTTQVVGVPNVDIEIIPVGDHPPNGQSSYYNCNGNSSYCTTTDGAGYFEVDEIYYQTGWEFEIRPVPANGQEFIPTSIVRKLTPENRVASDVDFIDLSSSTLSGKVVYPGDGCGVSNVTVLVNGVDVGVRTAADGSWQYVVVGSGQYRFEPIYQDFSFENDNGAGVTDLYAGADISDIDFTVTTQRKIEILVQGGCATPLGSSVELQLSNNDGCFDNRMLTVGADGRLIVEDIAPRDGYTLKVLSIEVYQLDPDNILNQFTGGIEFDIKDPGTYEKLKIEETDDGTTTSTITEDFPTLDFTYRGEIRTEIDFAAAGAELADCGGGDYDGLPIVQKNVKYPLEIRVFEELGADDCPVDEGQVLVTDQVSDREAAPEYVPIVNGIARYDMVAGEPNATQGNSGRDYQKYLRVAPEVDFATGDPLEQWLIVEGFKNTIPEFVTTTPEIPQLILHDPPGDNSYAFVEKGTTITTFMKNSVLTGGSQGSFTSLSVGGQASVGPSSVKVGSSVEMSLTEGTNETQEEGLISTLTFTESFSTSSLENFTGEDGDVYIGAALNQTYDIATEVSFNNCAVEIESSLIYGLLDFATTFIYTESHIKNSLLPQLQKLMALSDTDTEAGKRQYNDYLADYNSWQRILEANASNRDNATDQFLSDENVSISAGATLSKSYSVLEGIETSYQYDIFLEEEFTESIDASISTIGLYLDTQNGSMITSNYEFSEFQSESEDVIRTIGYVIEDNDIGDAITFNVYQDPDYDTPIFRLLSGRTSCPYEPNTAPRDQPAISINPSVINDIPFDGQGQYTLHIENNSQSGEAREYHVRVVSTTNPDGAIVRLAGNIINNSPVSLFVGANNYVDLVLTVDRGPKVDTYQDIQIMVYPPCEYELWQDGGVLVNADTIALSANFESQCTQVSLLYPGNNWIVNQASNNILPLTIGGYDVNNAAFESVSIWVKKGNEGYKLVQEVPKAALSFPYHDLDLDMSAYADGNYTVKVSANCNGGSLLSYSNEVSGVIDRSSLAPFGYPSPSDGFLREGQNIRVEFDQDISNDLSGAEISLTNTTTGVVTVIDPQVSGNVLLINPQFDIFDPALKGAEYTAHVHKLKSAQSGNVQKYPVDWSFVVNVEPVFWDPEIISLVAPAGNPFSFEAGIKNISLLPKTFSLDPGFDPTLIKIPDWLTPQTTDGVILPNGEAKIGFAFDTSLPPGIYQGEVTALVDSEPITLYVTIEYLAERINWSVNTTTYENSMNLVMQFEAVPGSNQLSRDTRDLIAAFVNGEIRGVAPIEYVNSMQVYRAFMTVYGTAGSQADDIEFRFWTALDGREYGAVETVPFAADVVTGSIEAPFILHPAGNFQVIPLQQGWNFISLNVNPVSTDRSEVLKSIMNTDNRMVLKSLKNSAEYTAATGWQGNLKTVDPVKGYMIYLSDHPDTLRVVGSAVPLPYDLSVSSGWNWIGFAGQDPTTTDATLQDLTPADGDLLKSQTEFATYKVGPGWTGSLATMEPGSGYKLQLGSSGTITYRGIWEVDPHAWEHNMVVTAVLQDAVLPQQLGEEWLLGAFVDGLCRGFTDFSNIDVLGEQRAFLLVYGQPEDAGKVIQYRLLNQRTGEELAIREVSGFAPNGLIGAILEPQPLHIDYFVEQINFELVPNPVQQSAQLLLETNVDQTFKLELRSLDGRLLRTLVRQHFQEGKHRLPVDLGSLPGGVYLLQLTGDGIRQVRRLVKQ